MVKHLLNIVEGEATEDGETTIKPEVLSDHESAGSGGGNNERSETGEGDDGDTCEKRATEIEVLVGLCGCANEGDGAHHTGSIETGACEESGVHEEEWRQEQGLSAIESGPEGVFLNIAVNSLACLHHLEFCEDLLLRISGHCSIHGSDAANQTDT